MDVLVLSYEDIKLMYNEEGYKTIYEKSLETLKDARATDPRWGLRFFAYDHLALVNPAAYEDVGVWDTMIPYYITDCDMHSRLRMRNWTIIDAAAGHVVDVASYLADLSVLWRVDGKPDFVDPNPPPLEDGGGVKMRSSRIWCGDDGDDNLARFRAIGDMTGAMYRHKHGDRGRNTWQDSQHGGQGEPYHYNARGFAEALNIMIETGRQVYKVKWGHIDCGLLDAATDRKFEDQWMVEKDWKFKLWKRDGEGEGEEEQV